MIIIPSKEGEDRKTYLVRVAVAYINSVLNNSSFDETIYHNGVVWEGETLVADLEQEFAL